MPYVTIYNHIIIFLYIHINIHVYIFVYDVGIYIFHNLFNS